MKYSIKCTNCNINYHFVTTSAVLKDLKCTKCFSLIGRAVYCSIHEIYYYESKRQICILCFRQKKFATMSEFLNNLENTIVSLEREIQCLNKDISNITLDSNTRKKNIYKISLLSKNNIELSVSSDLDIPSDLDVSYPIYKDILNKISFNGLFNMYHNIIDGIHVYYLIGTIHDYYDFCNCYDIFPEHVINIHM